MKTKFMMTIVAGLTLTSVCAHAGEDSVLSIDGQEFITRAAAPAHMENVDTIYSGWVFRTDETQALEMDDFDNPSFVFVEQAEDLFETVDGSAGKACVSCHESPGGRGLEVVRWSDVSDAGVGRASITWRYC